MGRIRIKLENLSIAASPSPRTVGTGQRIRSGTHEPQGNVV